MKKTPENQLTIVESAVKPKPTKGEIIEAMAIIKEGQMRAENKASKERKEALFPLIKAAVEAHVKENATAIPTSLYIYNYEGGDVQLRYDFAGRNKLPKEIEKMVSEYRGLKEQSIPSLSKIKEAIRKGMANMPSRTERVESLVDTPETRVALEAMIEQLENPKKQ